jgi:arginine/lysine/ornithine decarboxylase
LLETLLQYARLDKVPFHTPGHKQGKGIHPLFRDFVGNNLFRMDLTVLEETDCLFHPTGVLKEAQDLAAEAFGADRTFFLINGTSGGNHALLMTVCNHGDRVIVGRNVHKSIIAAMIFTGIEPVYVMPEVDSRLSLIKNVTPAAIGEALARNPEAKAVVAVSPTYFGVSADLSEIATLSHACDKPLLVDAAHGPHLHFHPDLPQAALDAGADGSVESTHKILGGMTQASMLHVKGTRVDMRDLESVLFITQSTSPSYVLLASLDAARMQMATRGRELLDHAIGLASRARNEINGIRGLSCFSRADVTPFAHDPTKLTVHLHGVSLTGYQASSILDREFGIQPEMADLDKILFIISFADVEEDIERLVSALRTLAERYPDGDRRQTLHPAFPELNFRMAMSPREAFFAKQRTLPMADAVGEVSTELFTIYPPGLPVIGPGEIVSSEAVEYLQDMSRTGAIIDGPIARGADFIRVVA